MAVSWRGAGGSHGIAHRVTAMWTDGRGSAVIRGFRRQGPISWAGAPGEGRVPARSAYGRGLQRHERLFPVARRHERVVHDTATAPHSGERTDRLQSVRPTGTAAVPALPGDAVGESGSACSSAAGS